MPLFKNKYRIASSRLQNWDYGSEGAYFITICTKDRIHHFGEIKNGKMKYSPVGAIADVLWYEIKNHAKNVELDAFVVMPNHIHGILILSPVSSDNMIVETLHATSLQSGSQSQSKSRYQSPLPLQSQSPALPLPEQQHNKNDQMAKISPKSNSVSTIIRSYKSAVTMHANRLQLEFAWQTRFHDHIIRNDQSFKTIQNYILNNPLLWEQDQFNTNKAVSV